jgi:hypothetical protein
VRARAVGGRRRLRSCRCCRTKTAVRRSAASSRFMVFHLSASLSGDAHMRWKEDGRPRQRSVSSLPPAQGGGGRASSAKARDEAPPARPPDANARAASTTKRRRATLFRLFTHHLGHPNDPPSSCQITPRRPPDRGASSHPAAARTTHAKSAQRVRAQKKKRQKKDHSQSPLCLHQAGRPPSDSR